MHTVNAMDSLTLYLDLHDVAMCGQVFIIAFGTCIILYASNIYYFKIWGKEIRVNKLMILFF